MESVDSHTRVPTDLPVLPSRRRVVAFILSGSGLSLLSVLGLSTWTYAGYSSPCNGVTACLIGLPYPAFGGPFEAALLVLAAIPASAAIYPHKWTRLAGCVGVAGGIVLLWAVVLGLDAWYASHTLGINAGRGIVSPGSLFWFLVVTDTIGAWATVHGLGIGKGPREVRTFSFALASFIAAIALVFGGFFVGVSLSLFDIRDAQYVLTPALIGGTILVGGGTAAFLLALRAQRRALFMRASS